MTQMQRMDGLIMVAEHLSDLVFSLYDVAGPIYIEAVHVYPGTVAIGIDGGIEEVAEHLQEPVRRFGRVKYIELGNGVSINQFEEEQK